MAAGGGGVPVTSEQIACIAQTLGRPVPSVVHALETAGVPVDQGDKSFGGRGYVALEDVRCRACGQKLLYLSSGPPPTIVCAGCGTERAWTTSLHE